MGMTNEEQHRISEASNKRIEETLVRIDGRVEKISDTIHGNGQVGLKTMVDRHTQTIGIFRRFFWIVVVGAVSLAGTVIAAVLL